jgi:hypothetical protein
MIAFSATQSQTSKLEGAPSTWQRLLPRSGVGARAGIEFIDENGDGRPGSRFDRTSTIPAEALL